MLFVFSITALKKFRFFDLSHDSGIIHISLSFLNILSPLSGLSIISFFSVSLFSSRKKVSIFLKASSIFLFSIQNSQSSTISSFRNDEAEKSVSDVLLSMFLIVEI